MGRQLVGYVSYIFTRLEGHSPVTKRARGGGGTEDPCLPMLAERLGSTEVDSSLLIMGTSNADAYGGAN